MQQRDRDDNLNSCESFEEHDTLSNDNSSDLGINEDTRIKTNKMNSFIGDKTKDRLEIIESSGKFINDKRSSGVSMFRRGESVIEHIDKVNQLEFNSGRAKALKFLMRNNKDSKANAVKRINSVTDDQPNELENFRNNILNSFLNHNRIYDQKRRVNLKKVSLS